MKPASSRNTRTDYAIVVLFVLMLVKILGGAQTVLAMGSWTDECRSVASHPRENGNAGIGVRFDDLNPEEAIPACRRAVSEKATPENLFRLGRAYDKAEQYSSAVPVYLLSAEMGYAPSMNNLASLFREGDGLPKNNAVAAVWYRKAADQGYTPAEYILGWMYHTGNGLPQDDTQAMYWYRRAAEKGYAKAETNVGWMHEYGRGVPQDSAEAGRWYRRAAVNGDAVAQYNLGLLHEIGSGVAEDHSEAVRWYRKAAEQGYAKAQNNLGALYHNGTGVARDYEKARHWYLKAAGQGYYLAQHNLGKIYFYGDGVEINGAEALRWFQKAADQDHDEAYIYLGRIYELGDSVPVDLKRAEDMYRLASKSDDPDLARDAQDALHYLLEEAHPQNRPEGLLSALSEMVHVDGVRIAEAAQPDQWVVTFVTRNGLEFTFPIQPDVLQQYQAALQAKAETAPVIFDPKRFD